MELFLTTFIAGIKYYIKHIIIVVFINILTFNINVCKVFQNHKKNQYK